MQGGPDTRVAGRSSLRDSGRLSGELSETIAATLHRHGLTDRGGAGVVALSGGGDSVALTAGLLKLRDRSGLRLTAAHVHHGLRPSADDDQAFVEEFCRGHDLPLRVRRLDGGTLTRPGGNVLARARAARQDFFREIAAETGADWIALGHTRDDVAETVAMRAARGSGLRGLRAMTEWDAPWFRPLTGIGRTHLRGFLLAEGLTWREDPGNSDFRRMRAYVRHAVLPAGEVEPAEIVRLGQAAVRLWTWLARSGTARIDMFERGARLHVGTRSEMLVREWINVAAEAVGRRLSGPMIGRAAHDLTQRAPPRWLDRRRTLHVGGATLTVLREPDGEVLLR